MLWFTIKWTTISFLVVYFIHYIYCFLLDMFTVHKTINYVPMPVNPVPVAINQVSIAPTPAPSAAPDVNMHAELDAFLKQLKSSSNLDPTSTSLQHAPFPATV
jgi:hypothetical protein